jgi:hypothetical protein
MLPEKMVQEALDGMVGHRLNSTIHNCDVFAVLDKGNVVDRRKARMLPYGSYFATGRQPCHQFAQALLFLYVVHLQFSPGRRIAPCRWGCRMALIAPPR